MHRVEWLKQVKPTGIGLEVGVKKGIFSRGIFENTSLYMYLLDAWRYFPTGYIDEANVENKVQIERMAFTLRNLIEFEGRFTLIRDTSEGAAKIFRDEFFDFIYIDANHSYESCKQDLELWYPKLKKGGILSGHDYLNRVPDIGVKQAVDEFFAKNNIKVQDTGAGVYPSFFGYK